MRMTASWSSPFKELTEYKVVERGFAFTDRRFPSDRRARTRQPRSGPDHVQRDTVLAAVKDGLQALIE